ncbi:MAG: serine/threonine protein kinase [Planctomycetaceae bacterium]|nr:serine/threonine protein kinase [Planctomycetaceae bacterium]
MAENHVRYQMESQPIGSGGFGKVRKGRDTVLDRDIAVKSLDPVLRQATDIDRERFREEARTLAQLAHPNIPAIYDVILDAEHFHIIFQYVEGKNMRQFLADGPLTVEEVRRWFGHIASALDHAHKKNRIHRDLKPENFIVTTSRLHCYLADFGLALSPDEKKRLTKEGYVVGTPGYMSPEHEDGKELDFSDDVYVLGICLYEALSGHRPAPADYRPLHIQNEAIPPSLDSLIEACLCPKPRRLASASEFARKLEHAFIVQQPLSSLLAAGQLHEIIAAIRDLTPDEFMELPPGQRLLVMDKCEDLLAASDERLATARAEFFAVIVVLAIHAPTDRYRPLAEGGIQIGYELKRTGGEWIGDRRVRDAMREASIRVGAANHAVLAECVVNWLDDTKLEEKEAWFFHAVRELFDRLLANPHCSDEHAALLSGRRREINKLQRIQH